MTAVVTFSCDSCDRMADYPGADLEDWPPGWSTDNKGLHYCPRCQGPDAGDQDPDWGVRG